MLDSHKVFITVEPIGALPRRLEPTAIKFIPITLLMNGSHRILDERIQSLVNHGWEYAESGGLYLTIDSSNINYCIIPERVLSSFQNQDLLQQLLLQLTTFGWIYSYGKGLHWPSITGDTYLAPKIIERLKNEESHFIAFIMECGWRTVEPGYYLSYKACSPYLPITPDAIISECKKAINAGAAIAHIHTRNCKKAFVTIPGVLI